MKHGIKIVVDEKFHETEVCSLCREKIGDQPFVIDVELVPESGKTKYEHIECQRAN